MIEYRFRIPNAAVFTLYSYSIALEYRFRAPTAASLTCDHDTAFCFPSPVTLSLVSTNMEMEYDIQYALAALWFLWSVIFGYLACSIGTIGTLVLCDSGCYRWSVVSTSNWWASNQIHELSISSSPPIESTNYRSIYVSCKWELWLWWVGDSRIQHLRTTALPLRFNFQDMMPLFTPFQK
jgi:hypothetical protein